MSDDKSTRPWGRYEVLQESDFHKVKCIYVKSGNRLSYQRHQKRREHWFIVSGVASVVVDGVNFTKHQLKKLQVGGCVMIKPSQFTDNGDHRMHVSPDTTAKIMTGKGFKYKMQKGEHIHDTVTGGKINWKNIGNSFKSGFQKVGKFLAPIAKPILHTVADMAAPMAIVAGSEFGPVGSMIAGTAADHLAHGAVDSICGGCVNPARFVVPSPSHHIHLGSGLARVNSAQMSPHFSNHNQSHTYNPLRKGGGLFPSGGGLYSSGGNGLY